jgi:hypothetical protein
LTVHVIRDRLAADLPYDFAQAKTVARKQGRPTADRKHLAAAVARCRASDAAVAQVLGCNRATVWRLRRDDEQAARAATQTDGGRLTATKPCPISRGRYWAFADWTPVVAGARIFFAPQLTKHAIPEPERKAA